MEDLERKGRLAWVREDSMALLDPALYVVDEQQAIQRLKGSRNLRGRKRAAAARLAAWRETEAIRRNRPRQWIARDTALLEIAQRLPTSMSQLAKLEAVPPKLVSRVGKQLVKAVVASAEDDNDYRPPRPPTEAQKTLLKAMQVEVSQAAEALGITAETIASKRELSAIIVAGNNHSRLFGGWRREVIGEKLRRLL